MDGCGWGSTAYAGVAGTPGFLELLGLWCVCVGFIAHGVFVPRKYELLRVRYCEWFLGAVDVGRWEVVILDLFLYCLDLGMGGWKERGEYQVVCCTSIPCHVREESGCVEISQIIGESGCNSHACRTIPSFSIWG